MFCFLNQKTASWKLGLCLLWTCHILLTCPSLPVNCLYAMNPVSVCTTGGAYRAVFRLQMVLQSCSGAIRLPTVLTVHQELLQLGLCFTALFHMIKVAHYTGEAASAALKERKQRLCLKLLFWRYIRIILITEHVHTSFEHFNLPNLFKTFLNLSFTAWSSSPRPSSGVG